jgi:secreted trypsin-like serine protease
MSRRLKGLFDICLATIMVLASSNCTKAIAQSEPILELRKNYTPGEARQNRILHGVDASFKDHPWQVALLDATIFDKSHSNAKAQFCGGAVIAPNWVVTAAHCVDGNTKPSDICVLTGTANLLQGGKRIGVAKDGIIVHEHWKTPTKHDNDIALIHVDSSLLGTPIVGWGLHDDESESRSVTITGWGSTTWQKPPIKTNVLQAVTLPIVSHTRCNKAVSWNSAITDTMICIGDYEHGVGDSCRGDSGGPATSQVSSVTKLIGIVSWGPDQCGIPLLPSIYTRISQYGEWVTKNTGNEVKW